LINEQLAKKVPNSKKLHTTIPEAPGMFLGERTAGGTVRSTVRCPQEKGRQAAEEWNLGKIGKWCPSKTVNT